MTDYVALFFSRVYGITAEDYVSKIRDQNSEEFFKSLYGHNLGFDEGAVPEGLRSNFWKNKGYEVLSNKLLRSYSHENVEYKDYINDYFFNSDGFRGPKDFDGSEEIIFSGCSHTVGEGIPEDAIWGTQLAKELSMSYANISRSASSVYWSVDAIFGYLRKYKAKPKLILALMPDFHRVTTVSNPRVAIPYSASSHRSDNIEIDNQWIWDTYSQVPGYLKRPFPMESTITRETAMMLNLRAINSLEAYCEAADITFLWSTWAPDESEMFSGVKKEFPHLLKNYVDVKTKHWHAAIDSEYHQQYHEKPGRFGTEFSSYGDCIDKEHCIGIDCHQDLKEKYGKNFYRGLDWLDNKENMPHFGAHYHKHVAEEFIKEIENRENLRDK
jgi:hypothetical protein